MIGRPCPYAVALYVAGQRWMVQCRRRTVLGSAGWHLHDATVPAPLLAHRGVRIRWRSLSAADRSMEYDR